MSDVGTAAFRSLAEQLAPPESIEDVKARLAAQLEEDVQFHLWDMGWAFERLRIEQRQRWDELAKWAKAQRAARWGLPDALRIIRINEANRAFWKQKVQDAGIPRAAPPFSSALPSLPMTDRGGVATRLLLMR